MTAIRLKLPVAKTAWWQPAHMPLSAPIANADMLSGSRELQLGYEAERSGRRPHHCHLGFVRQFQHVHKRHQSL